MFLLKTKSAFFVSSWEIYTFNFHGKFWTQILTDYFTVAKQD